MYELIQAAARSYYLDCPVKIGLYVEDDGGAVLIDSGGDKDAGRRVRQLLERQGWRLKAIVNTHAHADHIGGNHYLQAQTGCPIFAPAIEAAFARHAVLESSFLYGGYPCKELRHKFLMAQESDVQPLSAPGFPAALTPIPLPGHAFDMTGYRTPDGVVYLGDCLSSEATLDKYGIPFIYDVGAYLDTLDAVAAMEGALFVPAHAPAAASIAGLARYNREKVQDVADRILALCRTPLCFEDILQALFGQYGLTMDFEQYVLVGSTVRSYLAWLKGTGRLEARFAAGRLLWAALPA